MNFPTTQEIRENAQRALKNSAIRAQMNKVWKKADRADRQATKMNNERNFGAACLFRQKANLLWDEFFTLQRSLERVEPEPLDYFQTKKVVAGFVSILDSFDERLNVKHQEMTEPHTTYTETTEGTIGAYSLNDLPPLQFQAMDEATEAIQEARLNIDILKMKWEVGKLDNEALVKGVQAAYADAYDPVQVALAS